MTQAPPLPPPRPPRSRHDQGTAPPPPPTTPHASPPFVQNAQHPYHLQPPVQQVIIPPRQGLTTGQVILIVLGVLAVIPFATCMICTIGAGSVASRFAEGAAVPPAPTSNDPKTTNAKVEEDIFHWVYDTKIDEMTGKTITQAMVISETKHELAFPHQGGTVGGLRIVQHPRNGLAVLVSVDPGQISCQSFRDCEIVVRFDDRAPFAFHGSKPASMDTKTLFLEPEELFLAEVKKSKTVAIEVPFYRDGNRIFHFNTDNLEWNPGGTATTPEATR